jgi:hypothetical protein
LLLVVNQPNEIQLGKLIKKELGEDNQFNLLDADLVFDSFQKQMLDWLKNKNGTWFSRGDGE